MGRLELFTVRRISKFSLIQVFVCGGMSVGLHEESVEMKVETSNMSDNDRISGTSADEDRRKFLATCGKFAAVTPPAITMLLSTSLNSTAIARSGAKGNNGFGNGGGDGSPNGKTDTNR